MNMKKEKISDLSVAFRKKSEEYEILWIHDEIVLLKQWYQNELAIDLANGFVSCFESNYPE